MNIVAAVDGSALQNPGIAGWSWYINKNNWVAGSLKHATNNQAELMAVLNLLKSTANISNLSIEILCDSKYVINSLTAWMPNWKRNNWRKSNGKMLSNLLIMKTLDKELYKRNCYFQWVKSHTGNILNEKADKKAKEAALKFKKNLNKISKNIGPGISSNFKNEIQ